MSSALQQAPDPMAQTSGKVLLKTGIDFLVLTTGESLLKEKHAGFPCNCSQATEKGKLSFLPIPNPV